MGTLTKKLDSLKEEIAQKINRLLEKKGKESKFQNKKVLKVKDEQQFNLDGGCYLIEISADELIDNNGYVYNHSFLTIEQWCAIIDSI